MDITIDNLKPKRRSKLRLFLGKHYYTSRQYLKWSFGKEKYAKQSDIILPHVYAQHKTPLMRKLKDVDMYMQVNKTTNLKIACQRMNGVMLRPGETFSYWKMIGKPTAKKGYLEGLVLNSGTFRAGIGGGLCQLSNLIYWITIHTPLTVVERYRHSFDVFPDSNRTQPFGSGATCVYNYRDLVIRNDTNEAYQLCVWVDDTYLRGKWCCENQPLYRYEVYEQKHKFVREYWGGYSRHNVLYRNKYNRCDELVDDEYVAENHALMMYIPFLEQPKETFQ